MKKNLIILISLLLLSSCNSKEGIIGGSTNQDCEAKVIPMEEIAELLKTKKFTGIQFIDIRTPHEYSMGHLPKAINVPMKNFFDEERYEHVNTDDMLILYGDDASTPKMMGLLADHFKKEEFHVAMGGYAFLKDIVLNSTDTEDAIYIYDDEIPKVDFQKEIDAIVARSGASSTKSTKKKPTTTKPLVIRKKKAVSGGCG